MSSIPGASAIYQFISQPSSNEGPQCSSDVLFTFLHVSDLRLDQVPDFGDDMSSEITRMLLDSPYESVRTLFAMAIDNSVDFILLAGNVLQAQYTGPKGRLFLAEQFELLNRNKIAVYWSASASDPSDGWFRDSNFPPNVHRFPDTVPEEIVVRKNLKPVARIIGLSDRTSDSASGSGVLTSSVSYTGTGVYKSSVADSDSFDPQRFLPTAGDLYSIACIGVQVDDLTAQRIPVDYIALGGRRTHEVITQTPRLIVYPGMLQGRFRSELDSFGAVYVPVRPDRTAAPGFVSCQALQRLQVEYRIEQDQTEEELANSAMLRIIAAADKLAAADKQAATDTLAQKPLLVHMMISFAETVNPKEIATSINRLVRPENRQTLLYRLRQRLANRQQLIWVMDLTVNWESLPELPKEKVSDILSEISVQALRWRKKKNSGPMLEDYLTDEQRNGDMAIVARIPTSDRDDILKEAEQMARDYLQNTDTDDLRGGRNNRP